VVISRFSSYFVCAPVYCTTCRVPDSGAMQCALIVYLIVASSVVAEILEQLRYLGTPSTKKYLNLLTHCL
jgi:hypothetical protein